MTELATTDRVVTRWVRLPAPDVVASLERHAEASGVSLEAPFTVADAAGRVTARANGRVGRTRVEIAVTGWPGELSEITIRRRGRQLVAWGDRRERRYFDRAHDAAAGMTATLAA